MPIYDYACDKCKGIREVIQLGNSVVECCGVPMRKLPALPAYVRVKGKGYPSRRKWMERWTPASPPFPTAEIHGEKS